MTIDRRSRGKSGRKGPKPEVYEETLQVRVRSKNPPTERKSIEDSAADSGLAGAREGDGAGAVVARATVPVVPRTPLYEELESSDVTQRFEVEDPPVTPERAAPRSPRPPPDRPTAEPARLDPRPRRERAQPLLDPSVARGPRRAALLDEDLTELAESSTPMASPLHEEAAAERQRPEPGRVASPKDRGRDPAVPPPLRGRDRAPAPLHRSLDPEEPPRSRERAALPRPNGGAVEPRPEPSLPPEAVPRELLGKWGTDAVGAAAHRATVARRDEALPEVASPLLKSLRAELGRDELRALDRCLAGELDEQRTEPSLSPKRALEHLLNEHAFNELTGPERARLLRVIAGDARDIATTKSAIAILKTGVARRLRSEDRDKLLAVFAVLDSETRALFARTAARALRGRSALEDRDHQGKSVVAHLHRLARGEPLAASAERLGMRRGRALLLLLGTLANPERLPFEEGGDGVLGMLEYALADASPAELARLWVDLVTGPMAATLPGGERLDLGERLRRGASPEPSSRDTPLRLGLECLAELVGVRGRADRSGFIMPGGHGVDADAVSRALALLYGVGFTVAAGAPAARRHLERSSRDPQRSPPVFVTLLYERGERLFLFHHFDEHGVILRAPHGRSTKRRHQERADPPRLVEDPDLGLDRIELDALERGIGVALVPRS